MLFGLLCALVGLVGCAATALRFHIKVDDGVRLLEISRFPQNVAEDVDQFCRVVGAAQVEVCVESLTTFVLDIAHLHGNYSEDGVKAGLSSPTKREFERMNSYIEHLRPGDSHYKAFVGEPKRYGELSLSQMTLLHLVGLRESHSVLEIGCGSLRLGRLLIPYLLRDKYYCVEPEKWLVDTALRYELGGDQMQVAKSPHFAFRYDFTFSGAPNFDFIIAQSIFSHTNEEMLIRALQTISSNHMQKNTVLLATFVVKGLGGNGGVDPSFQGQNGWVYPGCVLFERADLNRIMKSLNLSITRLDYPHPFQMWFAISKNPVTIEIVENKVNHLSMNQFEPWSGLETNQVQVPVVDGNGKLSYVTLNRGEDIHIISYAHCADVLQIETTEAKDSCKTLLTDALSLELHKSALVLKSKAIRNGDGNSAGSLDFIRLNKIAKQLRQQYQEAVPFPHISIDTTDILFERSLLRSVASEFPANSAEEGLVFGWGGRRNQGTQWLKNYLAIEELMGPATLKMFQMLKSSQFVRFLELLTGIQDLIPDPHFLGSGLHQTLPGGMLQVHTDFNRLDRYGLWRRVNVFIFLNENWQDSWGGHLELWNHNATKSIKRFPPEIGRLVIFSTSPNSFHGHPEPLNCPPNNSRKSIALYYYSKHKHELVQNEETCSTKWRSP